MSEPQLVQPKIRGFICTTAHPEGCRVAVRQQIDYVKSQSPIDGPKRVLVIGASTGYGLASRITAAFGCGAKTIGVFFERPASGKRTGSAGWYNSAAFEEATDKANISSKSFNGDAFSDELKTAVCDYISKEWGQVDCVIYSLAAPRRHDPRTETTYNSVLKPTGGVYQNLTLDTTARTLKSIELEPAVQAEIDQTIQVMGGEDWSRWIECLLEKDLIAEGGSTVAYSYIGPELTYPIYREGTIGKAKQHLEGTAGKLTTQLEKVKGSARVAVNKAVVTQASSAIPVVPLYISMLYKVMKEKGTHEGCIEQIYRLFKDSLCVETPALDEAGRIRIDDLEMDPEVQQAVSDAWEQLDDSTLESLSDIDGYMEDFYHLFGFGFDDVNYMKPIDLERPIPSLN